MVFYVYWPNSFQILWLKWRWLHWWKGKLESYKRISYLLVPNLQKHKKWISLFANFLWLWKEYNQEFEDGNIQPSFGIEEFDIRGMMKGSNRIGQPDGKLDYDEFQNSIRKIPGIYEKFPGMSQFMSDFVDMFCNGTN